MIQPLSSDPRTWSLALLTSLPRPTLDALTRRVAGSLAVGRVLLGRCLLAIEATDLAEHYGCNSSIHYAICLGLEEREARECRRVAARLEELPLLRQAAESGELGWTKLREVVRKAVPETEQAWLELAQGCPLRRLERLVARTGFGLPPGQAGPDSVAQVECSELKLRLCARVMELFQLVCRKVSGSVGRRVAVAEVLELLCAEYLGGAPPDAEPAQPAPWCAVAAEETPNPQEPELHLVVPAAPHWQPNPRLKFTPENRLLTRAQRRDLLRRDGYACDTPGCPNYLWLHVHHVVFYCQGGATVPDNLVVCCSACHRNLHRGNLSVTGSAPHLQWSAPGGSLVRSPEGGQQLWRPLVYDPRGSP